ncbi:MAG: translocation/assembly module TamB domain-containing protein [Steroidobacteraceae bacterium]
MKLRHLILLDLLTVLLLTPVVALYYTVVTEPGLQFVAARLNRTIGPVTLTLEGASGTLRRGFHLDRLRVQHRLADVDLHDVAGKIDFVPLLAQIIQLREVKIGRADVHQFRNTLEGGKPRAPRFLPRLMQINVEDLAVTSGSLSLANGLHYEARDARAAGRVSPQQIRLRRAALALPEQRLRAEGTMRLRSALPLGLEGDLRLRYLPEDLPEWQISASFGGDLDKLPLKVAIDAPFRAHAEGAAVTLTDGWSYAGKGEVSDVDITDFGGGGALGLISGQLDIKADGDGYQARGRLLPAGLKAGAFDVEFDGLYRERRLLIRSASARHAGSGTKLDTRGSVRLADQGGPVLDLAGNWSQFRWPLTGAEVAVTSAQGKYHLRGQKPWAVEASGEFSSSELPPMPFTVNGRLSGERFDFDDARVELLDGSAELHGLARWSPDEAWQIEGRAERIDPASLRADLPGRLSFDFNAAGAPFGGEARLAIGIGRLTGRLRNASAQGEGRAEKAAGSDVWQFHQVDLRLGRTQLQLDGKLGPQRDLNFAVDADDLSLLDPQARGRLSARGRIAGTGAAPLLLFKARGTDFSWGSVELAALNADMDLDLGPQGHTAGQIQLTGLAAGRRRLERASITLSGQPAAQRIVADIEAAPIRAGFTAQGVFSDSQWKGKLQTLLVEDVDADRNLRLTMEAPADLAFSAQTLDLGDLCLKGAAARLCLALQRGPQSWLTRFSAGQLPLRLLTTGLAQDVDYNGEIDLQGNAVGGPGRLPTGELHGELTGAELVHHVGNNRVERIALGSGRVDASATDREFSATIGLDAGEAGHVQGKVQGERRGERWQDYPLSGQLELATNGLGMLEAHVAEIDRATGKLHSDMRIGGTLGAPTIAGRLELRDTRIDVYRVNLSLQDLNLDADLDTNALRLTGQTRIGEGTAKVSGRLSWRDLEPYGDLHVEGENLLLVDVPEARIHASPNLDFKLAGRRINATGTVKIPAARLEPADLTNAVLASGDEVLVGTEPVDPAQRWLVVSDIRLELGDAVEIDALGLSARLGGGIQVRLDENGVTRGLGELNVTSGRYAALGRLLDISRGRLLFSNGPLGDPGIDLRAQKEFPDITAGVNVRGTLRAPRMTFFSEPSIPQSQIASLILAGGSLESVQNSNQNGAARNDLLAQGGAILAQQFGNRVGIEDVSIESDLSNETSLVLGKYLSPRLYVSYGISLAEAINTLKLRYTITDNWTIKTESGKARSADVVYTVEK